MKRYPKYKDSGIDWLGEIPEHWEVIPLTKNLSSLADYRGKTPEKIESGIFLVTTKNIRNGVINYEISKEYVAEENYLEIMRRGLPKIGDILLTMEAPLGEVANVDFEMIALAQRIIKLRVKKDVLNPYFVKYVIMSQFFQYQIQKEATGSTAQGIKASKLHKLKVLKTSLTEQSAIACFIDRKLVQIDQFISNKQRFIELLKEQKSAIINRAVTKGLNPDAPMKPSGIEWLGDIPAHWRIRKLKWFAKTESGSTPDSGKQKEYYDDGNINWVRTLDLNNDEIWDTEIKITEKAIVDTSCKIVPPGTVIIAMYGGDGTIGKNGILRIFAATNQAVCCILPNNNFLPEFLHRYVQFYRPHWMFDATGARKDPNISQEIIRELIVVFPPMDEQKKNSSLY